MIDNWMYCKSENIYSIDLSTLKRNYMIVRRRIRHPVDLKREIKGSDFEYIYKPEDVGIFLQPFWCIMEEDKTSEFGKRRIIIMDR